MATRRLYSAIVRLLRLTTRVFFRTVEVVGAENIPADGPVVFVGNHPNSLMDPALIITSCERQVSFAAKDVLFRSRFLRPILQGLGAVPIRRRMDHGGGALDNSAAFEALFEVLREGGAFGIFPEGISHTRSELAPLKTGAARIALGAAREGIPVKIVPCGLTYVHRTRARSRVLVQFGPAIDLAQETFQGDADESFRDGARALTDAIDTALRGLTINASDFATLRVLDEVRRLYRPPGLRVTLAERAELSRRFIEYFERLQGRPDVKALFHDVARFISEQRALGLRDRDLRRRTTAGARLLRVLQHVALLVVLVPLAIPGVIIHAPVLLVAAVAGNNFTRRKDVRATTKMTTALLMVLLGYALVAAAVAWYVAYPASLWAVPLSLVTLLLSGWATIRVLERELAVRRSLWVLLALLRFTDQLERLRVQREALRARLLELADRYIDPDLVRVIPREAQGAEDS